MDKKRKVVARDVYSVCTDADKHHGFSWHVLPVCGKKTYSRRAQASTEQQKMNNVN